MKFDHLIYLSFLITGVILTLFAFGKILTPSVLFAIFSLILVFILALIAYFFRKTLNINQYELYYTYLFIIIWSFHFLQVLVPETGFDSLWYHLPVVSHIAKNNGLQFLPSLYQSVNPLFADLYFSTGFSVLGIVGAKLIAYIFALLFVFASYSLSRLFLSRKYSLIIVSLISTFQVVAWQSSSFYVDVAKGFFEITGLLFLLY